MNNAIVCGSVGVGCPGMGKMTALTCIIAAAVLLQPVLMDRPR